MAAAECEGFFGLNAGESKRSFDVLDQESEEEMQLNSSFKTLPTTIYGDVFFNYAP